MWGRGRPRRREREDPRPDEGIDKAGHFADALAKSALGDALHQRPYHTRALLRVHDCNLGTGCREAASGPLGGYFMRPLMWFCRW